MPNPHQNTQNLGGGGLAGTYTNYGGGGVPVARSDMDFLRMGVGRAPQAEYPDGYLGTIRSRRDDRGRPSSASDKELAVGCSAERGRWHRVGRVELRVGGRRKLVYVIDGHEAAASWRSALGVLRVRNRPVADRRPDHCPRDFVSAWIGDAQLLPEVLDGIGLAHALGVEQPNQVVAIERQNHAPAARDRGCVARRRRRREIPSHRIGQRPGQRVSRISGPARPDVRVVREVKIEGRRVPQHQLGNGRSRHVLLPGDDSIRGRQ